MFSKLMPLPPLKVGRISPVFRLRVLIEQANSIVVFTGAGISTHAGIPDYRSPNGVWAQQEMLKRHSIPKDVVGLLVERGRSYAGILQPTPAHMAIFSLVMAGKVSMVVTQNLDGLHEESGVPVDRQAQLHGNIFKECCPKCKAEYIRKDPVKSKSKNVHDHRTGARCTKVDKGRICNGELEAFVVNFGDDLPESEMKRAVAACTKADLVIVVGSSMQVTPACEVPLITIGQGCPDDFVSGMPSRLLPAGKLVIINGQPTEYDGDSELVIRGDCQTVLSVLLVDMGVTVPVYSGAKPGVTPDFIAHKFEESVANTVALIRGKPLAERTRILKNLRTCLEECRASSDVVDTNPFSLAAKLERVIEACATTHVLKLPSISRGGKI